MGFTLGDKAAGIGGAVAMPAGHGAELLGAGLRAGPGHEADAAAIGGLDHAVARIAVRRCGLGVRNAAGYISDHEKTLILGGVPSGICLSAGNGTSFWDRSNYCAG